MNKSKDELKKANRIILVSAIILILLIVLLIDLIL